METLKAFVFGVTLAIAVGPIAVLIMNRGVLYGFRSGLMSGVGAALADFTYALVAFTIGSILLSYLHLNQEYFAGLASIVLVVFGCWMLKQSLRASASNTANNATKAGRGDLSCLTSTYFLTVINPLTIVAFLGFSGQLVTPNSSTWHVLSLSLAIFCGSLIIQAAIASLGAFLGSYVKNPKVMLALNIISSLFITAFGLAGFFKF